MEEIKGHDEDCHLYFQENNTTAHFKRDGQKRYVYDDFSDSQSESFGLVIVNGLIKFADKSTTFCLLKISEIEQGKLLDVGVFLRDGGIVFSSHLKFLQWIGKERKDVWPFQYKYAVPICCDDVYIAKDGWSLPIKLHDPGKYNPITIGGLCFKDLCLGTDEDRLFFLRRQFPGTIQGYEDMENCAKEHGVCDNHYCFHIVISHYACVHVL